MKCCTTTWRGHCRLLFSIARLESQDRPIWRYVSMVKWQSIQVNNCSFLKSCDCICDCILRRWSRWNSFNFNLLYSFVPQHLQSKGKSLYDGSQCSLPSFFTILSYLISVCVSDYVITSFLKTVLWILWGFFVCFCFSQSLFFLIYWALNPNTNQN